MGQLLSFFRNLTQRCRCSSEQQETESITLETVGDSKVADPTFTDVSRIAETGQTDIDGNLKLSDRQVEDLAEIIVSKLMVTIAIKYLRLPHETVENLSCLRQSDNIAFNRDLLVLWRNKNPGMNQIQASFFQVKWTATLHVLEICDTSLAFPFD